MKEISRDEIVAAYRDAFSGEAGQLVLGDLEARFGFTRRSMFMPGEDALTLAWRAGGREVLTYMGRMLTAAADDLKPQTEGER